MKLGPLSQVKYAYSCLTTAQSNPYFFNSHKKYIRTHFLRQKSIKKIRFQGWKLVMYEPFNDFHRFFPELSLSYNTERTMLLTPNPKGC